jgi:DNA polymerase epsilon subunit 1
MGRGTFGLVSSRSKSRGFRGNTSYRGRGRGRGGSANAGSANDTPAPLRDEDGTQLEERFEQIRVNDEVDEKLGFGRLQEGVKKEGWLVNMHPVSFMLSCYIRPLEFTFCRP